MNLGILADGISNGILIRIFQIYKRCLQFLVLAGHLCHVQECTAITSFTLMMCALGSKDWRTVAAVAEPDAKASACATLDSREARVASRALRLGLAGRDYS